MPSVSEDHFSQESCHIRAPHISPVDKKPFKKDGQQSIKINRLDYKNRSVKLNFTEPPKSVHSDMASQESAQFCISEESSQESLKTKDFHISLAEKIIMKEMKTFHQHETFHNF